MAKAQKEKPYVVIVGCGKVGEKILDRLYRIRYNFRCIVCDMFGRTCEWMINMPH